MNADEIVFKILEENPQGYKYLVVEELNKKLNYEYDYEKCDEIVDRIFANNINIRYFKSTQYYNALGVLKNKLFFNGYYSKIDGSIQNPSNQKIDFKILNSEIKSFSYFKNVDLGVNEDNISGTLDIYDSRVYLMINNSLFIIRSELISIEDHPLYLKLVKDQNNFSKQSKILTALNCGSYFVFNFILDFLKERYRDIDIIIEDMTKGIP